MSDLITNNDRYTCKGVVSLYAEEERHGIAVVKRFFFDETKMAIWNMRQSRNGAMFRCINGHYCQLFVNNELMMSDTPMERQSNLNFVRNANGRILIAGLGLGMIIHNILQRPEVQEVIVIEKYQDVIDLVQPKIQHPKLKVICADIFEWKPDKGDLFDVIYFDIWPEISTDNLKEISRLHNRFKNSLNRNNPKSFMASWMQDYLRKLHRQEQSEYHYRLIFDNHLKSLQEKFRQEK
jgi:hypothetical protein